MGQVTPTKPGMQMERPQGKIGEVLFVNLCYPCSYSRSRGTELALKGQTKRAFSSPTWAHVRARNKVEQYSRLIHRRQNYELSL
jgi:hypothetical protein